MSRTDLAAVNPDEILASADARTAWLATATTVDSPLVRPSVRPADAQRIESRGDKG